MESTLEALVEVFLTRCGRVFTSSQFDIPFNPATGRGGSNPDIVALDFSRSPREIVVVEVTTSNSVSNLIDRVKERQARWFMPLTEMLTRDNVVDQRWNIRFLGFVRKSNVESARGAFPSDSDVWFHAIEDAMMPYAYWNDRIASGLPRRPD